MSLFTTVPSNGSMIGILVSVVFVDSGAVFVTKRDCTASYFHCKAARGPCCCNSSNIHFAAIFFATTILWKHNTNHIACLEFLNTLMPARSDCLDRKSTRLNSSHLV